MFLKKLDITNFRKIKKQSFNFFKNKIFFIGENAQGKTSVLESINYLGVAKSHRTNKEIELINFDSDFSVISANINNKFNITNQIKTVITKDGRSINYNGVEMKKISEFIGEIPVVMFSTEDFSMIKGSPSSRRKFIDLHLGLFSKIYLFHLANYNSVLKTRNAFLKTLNCKNYTDLKDSDKIYLQSLTEKLVEHLIYILQKRNEFCFELINNANTHMKNLSSEKEELEIVFEPSVKVSKDNLNKEYIYKLFIDNADKDLYYKTTSIGVHRDDFLFLINKQQVKTFASSGQTRTVVLALKLALVSMFVNKFEITPILLLDDVFNELDIKRQEQLVNFLPKNIQTFITTTHIDQINPKLLDNSEVYEVVNGVVQLQE